MPSLPSSISAVTVFRRGAMVTRVADVDAIAGAFPGEVVLEGLPLSMHDDSLRIAVARIDDDTGDLPIAADAEVTVRVPARDSRLAPAENEELLAARLVAEQARRELSDLQGALARIESLSIGPRGEPEEGHPPMPSPTEARLRLLALRRAHTESLHGRIDEAKRRVRETSEHLATLEERERAATTTRNARAHELRKAIVVRLAPPAAARAARARVQVSYFVPGARWAPAYTVRLHEEMDGGVIEMRALVGQKSGEDWSGVALTLSTADAQRWTELPELHAMRIGRAQPPVPRTGWRPAPVGAAELYADYDRDLPPTPAAPVVAEAKAEPPPAPRMPPMPVSAPAPPSAAAPRPMVAAARSVGFAAKVGDAFGGIADAVTSRRSAPPPGAPAPLELEGEAEAEAAPRSAALGVDRALLDYGRLRLPGPDEPGRGALQPAPASASMPPWVADSLRTASAAAAFLEHRDAPPGHHWPTEEDGFSHVYIADAPVEIGSDDKLTSVPILARPVEATPRFVSVPRESLDVFRLVALRNPLDAPVLAGPADVYVAGRFMLASQLPTTPMNGRIELGLGVEQAIKIARNVKFEEDTAGLIKRQHALEHTIEIRVANHRARPAQIEIRERLPVAAEDQADDIAVEVVEVKPSWDEYEQKAERLEGGRAWKVEVDAGAEIELRAVWVAKIPSQHEIVGGNRRET